MKIYVYPLPTDHCPLENIRAVCDLSHLGLVKVSGTDAKKLLQGQLTCHLDDITSAQGHLGAHCNPQGRVISLFYIFLFQDAYYLLMPRHLMPIAMAALKKYAIFYKTELTDASKDLSVLGWIKTTEERGLIISLKEHRQELPEHFAQAPFLTSQEWKQLDLQEGIPAIYPETSGKFLPHEINLEKLGAIHFEKGCYTGQEIIARMHYRGKLKNHLYHAMIISVSPLHPGTDVYSQQNQEIKTSGVIVDACLATNAHDQQYDVLMVTDDSNAKPQHLFLNNHENEFFIIK